MSLVLLCFAFVIGLAGPSFAQPVLMAQSEVEAALPGKTFTFTSPSGVTGTIDFARDMSVSSTLEDGSIDKGTYRFAEGGYCSVWEEYREGEEACFTVEALGDGRYQLYTLDGGLDDLFVLK